MDRAPNSSASSACGPNKPNGEQIEVENENKRDVGLLEDQKVAGAEAPPVGNWRPLYKRDTKSEGIRDVWASNLEDEFKIIRQIIDKYPYVSMDTEFPGIVARPLGDFDTSTAYQYQAMRCNVGMLQLIQLGLTFQDRHGNTPLGLCGTWQFNFKFSLSDDMYAENSIDLLHHSGIQFQKHKEDGIIPIHFAELMMTSGVVLMDNVIWITFHAGYDFAYLLKLLTNLDLPPTAAMFFELLRLYFPTIYDVKELMKAISLCGGLQDLAYMLKVERMGAQHQAGSDALVTGRVFFKLRDEYFNGVIDSSKFCHHLYGLIDVPSSGSGDQSGDEKDDSE